MTYGGALEVAAALRALAQLSEHALRLGAPTLAGASHAPRLQRGDLPPQPGVAARGLSAAGAQRLPRLLVAVVT